jgi:hypothetical protein
MNAHTLQLIGLGLSVLSIWIGIGCWMMWKTLPVNKKVWAIVVLIAYCGTLMIATQAWVGEQFYIL